MENVAELFSVSWLEQLDKGLFFLSFKHYWPYISKKEKSYQQEPFD